MSKIISKEEAQNRIDKIHGYKNIIMTEYKSTAKKAKFQCSKCNFIWETTPRSIYYLKSGCPQCKGNAPITINKIEEYLLDNNLSSEYQFLGYQDKLKRHGFMFLYHKKCGNNYKVEIGSFLSGRRCPCDVNDRISKINTKDKDYMLFKLQESGVPYNYAYGFKSVSNYCYFTCVENNHLFKAIPRQIYGGQRGCSFCHTSKGELAIRKYLSDNNIEFTAQKCFSDLTDKRSLPFDFYLIYNEDKIAIEYQGQQHYFPNKLFGISSFDSTVKHDKMKKQYCITNDINLVTIPFLASNNQEHVNEYVKSILKSIL